MNTNEHQFWQNATPSERGCPSRCAWSCKLRVKFQNTLLLQSLALLVRILSAKNSRVALLNLQKAVLKRPQSRRFAKEEPSDSVRQHLDCVCLSTALAHGFRGIFDLQKRILIETMNHWAERRFPNRLGDDSINLPIWRSALRFMVSIPALRNK